MGAVHAAAHRQPIARAAVAMLAGALAVTAFSCGRGAASFETRERAFRANNLGVAALEQFRYPEAAGEFRDALRLDPSLGMAHVNLALALMYDQDEQGAAREAVEAARLLPSAPQPPYIQGLLARTANRTADALRDFERVSQIDPNDVGTNVNLGQIYLEQQQYARAIAVLRAAVAAEPYNVTAAYNLGLALTRSGAAEGSTVLQRAQALRTTGYAVTYGTGYLEQGHYAEALAPTGLEADLVDTTTPGISFTPAVIASGTGVRGAPSPFGRSFTSADLAGAGPAEIAAGLGGGLTLIDYDGDGDLDIFDASAAGQRLLRNDGHGHWTDVSASSGLGAVPPASVPIGCIVGDYDNDGRPDLFVLRDGVSSLYHNDGGGHFRDVTNAAGVPAYAFLPGAAAFVDVDHDGDLDLVIAGLADLAASRAGAADRSLAFPADFAPAPLQLLRNNGNGTFTDVTAAAHLTAAGHAIAIVPTDFDNRRDVDLMIVNRTGPPALFQNLRDGTFRDVAAEVGLAAAVGNDGEITAVTAADVNKDGYPDFFFARGTGGVFAMSDGRARFTLAPSVGVRSGFAAQFLDYDDDGLFDLLTWSADGPHLLRNLGQRWTDATPAAMAGSSGLPPLSSSRALAAADLDGDGSTDFVTGGSGSVVVWYSGGASGRRFQRVALRGVVGNRSGIGAKVEIRAGSLTSRIETSAASPLVAPVDILFGLGRRPAADAVRVLWPSGILQAEMQLPAPGSPMTIEELNRKPSSCPFLFTWNGERFEFVTDFMGGGEMGYLERPGEADPLNKPHPIEYVRIDNEQLQPKGGRYELRITNELEETLFADRMQLFAVAHPRDVAVYPDEGMTEIPKPFHLLAVTGARVPRAFDDDGSDVTERVSRIDRRYPDAFALKPFRGFAAPHTLTIDLAASPNESASRASGTPVLLLTGWTDYAFSSDNLAAHQAGLSLTPPFLQARDAAGTWRTIVADIGIPVGRPQTVPVALSGLRPGEHQVRIVTNMKIYWDRILVANAVPAASSARNAGSSDEAHFEMRALDPIAATLRARGFSAVVEPDGREPERYNYAVVSRRSPWKTMPGRYTREGDVLELLTRSDDKFVVAEPGDEIALSFDAAAAGPLPEGWTRTFLLLADGFSKEMDIHSASPDVVEPLPFHAMKGYPYRAPQHYPDTDEYRQYRDTYNTRVVARTVPPLAGPH